MPFGKDSPVLHVYKRGGFQSWGDSGPGRGGGILSEKENSKGILRFEEEMGGRIGIPKEGGFRV